MAPHLELHCQLLADQHTLKQRCLLPRTHHKHSLRLGQPRRNQRVRLRHYSGICRAQLPCDIAAAAQAIQAGGQQDIYATGIALAGALMLVKGFDYLAVHGVLDQKLSRKLVHISAGPLFLLSWPLFSAAPEARLFAAVVPALNALRLVLVGTGVVEAPGVVKAVSREGERRELLAGPLYYVLVLVAATLLFWRTSPVGLVAISLMCGGDGLADVIGRRWGVAKLPHNANKSWAGSAALWAGGTGLALANTALFVRLGYFTVNLPATAVAVAGIALAAALVESLPLNRVLDDNVSVPGVSVLLGCLLLRTTALTL